MCAEAHEYPRPKNPASPLYQDFFFEMLLATRIPIVRIFIIAFIFPIFLCQGASTIALNPDLMIDDALTVHNQGIRSWSRALDAHLLTPCLARALAGGSLRVNLTWSTSLADAAQSWSTHLAGIDELRHSSGSGQGENLFRSIGGAEPSFADASTAWVLEKPKYRGERIPDGDFEAYGHYTQVIWPDTREVGMGRTTSAQGWTYVVARYSPTGNYVGQKPGV